MGMQVTVAEVGADGIGSCGVLSSTGNSYSEEFIRSCDRDIKNAVYMLENGQFESAYLILEPLAKLGVAEAQYQLAEILYLGKGVPANEAAAVYWYRKAAEQEHVDAQITLGPDTIFRDKSIRSVDEAKKWILAAADQGNPWAQYAVATYFMRGRHGFDALPTEGIMWLERSAINNLPMAQYELGVIHLEGSHGIEPNMQYAIDWIKQAAENQFPPACDYLSDVYNLGLHGLPANKEKSNYWSQRANEARLLIKNDGAQ